MQRRTKIRTVLVGVIISWSLAIGWYSARVLPQEDLESIYALEQSANARLLTDVKHVVEQNEQDRKHLVQGFRALFQNLVDLIVGVLRGEEEPSIKALPFTDFESFALGDQESQLFFISEDQDFPKEINCFDLLKIPKHLRQAAIPLRSGNPSGFLCYVRDGRSYMGRVWRYTSKTHRKHMLVKRLSEDELALSQSSTDLNAALAACLTNQKATLERFPGALQAVLEDHQVLVSFDGLAPLSLPEMFFREGQNSGEVATVSGSLLVATTVREDGLTAITAVPKGDTQAKYYALAAFAVLGGLLIAAALLILGRWEDRRRS